MKFIGEEVTSKEISDFEKIQFDFKSFDSLLMEY